MFSRIFKRIKSGPGLIITVLIIAFLLVISTSDKLKPVIVKIYAEERMATTSITGKYYTSKSTRNDIPDTCFDITTEEVDKFFGMVKSNMDIWTFQEKIKCATHDIGQQFTEIEHRRMNLQCSSGILPGASYSNAFNSSDIFSSENGNSCLHSYIRTCCGSNRIPNIVHYVWYKRGEMSFVAFLSMLSVVRFVRPCVIMIHGELPYGKYWDAITYFYPNFVHINRDIPKRVFGTKITNGCHASDIMRIEALIEYGGIYFDMDTVLVRPIDALMDFPFVLSNQSSGLFGSAFVMSERNATFLQLWMNEYKKDYRPNDHVYNAMISTKKLAKINKYKHLIHVEPYTVSRPNGMLFYSIYNSTQATYNWSHIYGIHTYVRIFHQPVNETTIRTHNSTFGSICRHIFYGDKELCV